MDDKIMEKIAMAIKAMGALEEAREIARKELQKGEDWLKNESNTDPEKRIEVMNQCALDYKLIKLISGIFSNPITGGNIYSRMYCDLKD